MRAPAPWTRERRHRGEEPAVNPDLTPDPDYGHHLSDERKAQFDHVYELTPASSIV